jgi:hypothetical protein
MKIEGCKRKKRHLFIGRGKDAGEEKVESVRYVYIPKPVQRVLKGIANICIRIIQTRLLPNRYQRYCFPLSQED